MKTPYIGVTDFETGDQAREIANLYQQIHSNYLNTDHRKLMVGVMMSYKTLHNIPSKWSNVWVKKEDVSYVFVLHPYVYNTLHYADYDGHTTLNDLKRVVGYGGPTMHSLQLDMIWPNVKLVTEFRNLYPNIEVILQVGSNALLQIEDNPQKFVMRLLEYSDTLDYVLLDKSMGQGKSMDANILYPFVNAIVSRGLNIGVAVAGGIGPHTLHLVLPLAVDFPFISIDTQGQQRNSGNSMDPINWARVREFIPKALKMLVPTCRICQGQKVTLNDGTAGIAMFGGPVPTQMVSCVHCSGSGKEPQ